MELSRRRLLHLTTGTVTLSALSGPARAQDYPSKEARILVGFPAGGALDIAARIVAPWLSERLGQAFVVENRPGESGNIATRQVGLPPWCGGGRSEYQAAFRMVIASMLARASAGVR